MVPALRGFAIGVLIGLSAMAVLAQRAAPALGAPQVPTPPPTGTAFIFGRVVDGLDKSPVAGAIVTIYGTAQTAGPDGRLVASSVPERRVMTDGQGRFAFRDLPRGSYQPAARAAGYAPAFYGQKHLGGGPRMLELQDGQKVGDATVLMWKFAAITGTIVDDNGDLSVGTVVRLMVANDQNGKRRFLPGAQVPTDDRGMYRFGNLSAGDYAVAVPSTMITLPISVVDDVAKSVAVPPSPQTANTAPVTNPAQVISTSLQSSGGPLPVAPGVRLSDAVVQLPGLMGSGQAFSTTSDGRVLVFPTVFFPAAATSSQATVIALSAGEERANVDMTLRLVRTVTVSGTLTGPDGPQSHFGLRLMPAGVDDVNADLGFETAKTATDANGAFTFLGVPPGAYVIKGLRVPSTPGGASPERVTAQLDRGLISAADAARLPPALPADPTLWAQLPVSVSDINVSGLNVPLRTGLTVSGRLEFEGMTPKPPPETLARLRISLTPIDGRSMPSQPQGFVTPEGNFTVQSAPPGAYALNLPSISVGTSAWTVRSVMSGGRNVAMTSLVLTTADVGGVTVNYSDRPLGDLSGTIRLPPGTVPGSMSVGVIAIPVDFQAWAASGMSQRALRSGSAQPSGSYQVGGFLAGDYLVAAFDLDDAPVNNLPKLFESLARVATRVTIGEGEKKTLPLSLVKVR